MKPQRKEMRSGIYLLPNLFTTGSLFSAFYAIIASLKGQYDVAVVAIFIGMICDGLDGRIARLTNTQTNFGAEYDSLSDMVTFGVAPAVLLYSWHLNTLGKIGWLITFIYTAAVALRLARFNTQIDTADKKYFQGLSSTLGASVVIAFVWFCDQTNASVQLITILGAILTVCIAVLMVSNIRYYSFKELDFKGRVPFLYIVLIVISFVAIALNPSLILFLASLGYAISGPLQTVIALNKMRKARLRIRDHK